jgi:probable F420-dependent oxidoreductase
VGRRADDAGYYSLSVPDHLGPSLPQLAPLVALSAAAALTSRLRLTVTVLDNDFRHPVMVAKEVATLDLLSDGRVDMGMGAGWLEEDYTRTGITTWDPPGTRVSRLIESITLIEQLFTGQPVTFDGEHYGVSEFQSFPKPVQSPVPLMIGGRGKRMLTVAAKRAQIISILAAAGEGGNRLAGFEQQLGWTADAGGHTRSDLVIGIRVPFGQLAASGESTRGVAARVGAPWA